MDENALKLHPSFILHHIFLRENDRWPRADVREETALTPVVIIQFLPFFVGGELWKL